MKSNHLISFFTAKPQFLLTVIAYLIAIFLGVGSCFYAAWYPGKYLLLLLQISLLLALISVLFFGSSALLGFFIRRKEYIIPITSPSKLINLHGFRFWLWFIAHSLIWIFIPTTIISFLFVIYGSQIWVIVFNAGLAAVALFTVIFSLVAFIAGFAKWRLLLGICWRSPIVVTTNNFWDWLSSVVSLPIRFFTAEEYDHRHQNNLLRRITHVLDIFHNKKTEARNVRLWEENSLHLFFKEQKERSKASISVFLTGLLVAILLILLTPNIFPVGNMPAPQFPIAENVISQFEDDTSTFQDNRESLGHTAQSTSGFDQDSDIQKGEKSEKSDAEGAGGSNEKAGKDTSTEGNEKGDDNDKKSDQGNSDEAGDDGSGLDNLDSGGTGTDDGELSHQTSNGPDLGDDTSKSDISRADQVSSGEDASGKGSSTGEKDNNNTDLPQQGDAPQENTGSTPGQSDQNNPSDGVNDAEGSSSGSKVDHNPSENNTGANPEYSSTSSKSDETRKDSTQPDQSGKTSGSVNEDDGDSIENNHITENDSDNQNQKDGASGVQSGITGNPENNELDSNYSFGYLESEKIFPNVFLPPIGPTEIIELDLVPMGPIRGKSTPDDDKNRDASETSIEHIQINNQDPYQIKNRFYNPYSIIQRIPNWILAILRR
jgi:hypothetical protein